MGKIIAIGGAEFDQPDSRIMEVIHSLVRKTERPRMVFLPTAGHDTHGDEERANAYFGSMGYEVTHLYLTDPALTDETIRDAILNADLVYVPGGNLQFLMRVWRARKVDVYLRQAYEAGTVLAGSSSGAMCWFDLGYDDCGPNDRFMFIRGVGLLPYCMCPHFQNDFWHPFTEAVGMQELDGIGIDDTIGVLFDEGKVSVIKNYPHAPNSAFIMRADEDYRLSDLAALGERFALVPSAL